MKLFEMEGFLRGKCIPRDLKVNETNAEYLVRKFAEADARCAALAAENAGLKSAIEKHADSYIMCGYCLTERDGKNDDVCEVLDSIPDTDAFLAEVRAQGVERLANAWYAIANETDPGISISDSSRLKYRQRADDAADFANEIRQEAAQ
ncbi:hypothetical protein LWU32_11335 [Enterobacter hormaechei]|uniref:hypothetical protein n=1 Tax=Enterobacter cloacae TaxID=550 RepID=UPI00325BEAF7|nr:hypothetical protein [Enterobacter hormaechei]